jgi:meiotic recombination protein REC8, fungi type
VATCGPRSSTRRITRKAIQEVNVPKACGTIEDPGAPIALRLQANLLYGVSRVYQEQCTYLLTDAEKTQLHLRKVYRILGGRANALDENAGKAK